MLFGFHDASGTFQCRINVLPSTVKWQFALVYLGYIVIFSKFPSEHSCHARNVLLLFRNSDVTLWILKCWLCTERMDYLEQATWPRRVEIASKTTNSISNLQSFTNHTELFSFLELCILLAWFVSNFARSYGGGAKCKSAKWPTKQIWTFQRRRVEIHEFAKTRAYISNCSGSTKLHRIHQSDTNTCDVRVGWVLLQRQHGSTTKPIGFS